MKDMKCPECGHMMGTDKMHGSMLNDKKAMKEPMSEKMDDEMGEKKPIKSMLELRIAIGKHLDKKGKK